MTCRVADVMTESPVVVRRTTDMTSAARLLLDTKVRSCTGNSLLRPLRGLISYSTPWTCTVQANGSWIAAVPNDTEANLLSRMLDRHAAFRGPSELPERYLSTEQLIPGMSCLSFQVQQWHKCDVVGVHCRCGGCQ